MYRKRKLCQDENIKEKVSIGSIYRNYCQDCGKFYDAKYVKQSPEIPKCECGGIIKPNVVLYAEGLDNTTIQKSLKAISEAVMRICVSRNRLVRSWEIIVV